MEPLANKAEYLLTIAAVPIAALQFTSALRSKHRPLCQKNVKRICKIYRLEGCNRSDEDNFISAVVDPVVYHTACAAPPRMFVSSSNVPLLDLERVECLDGLHRIAAAKSFLDEAEPWWIVKLYSSSLPEGLFTQMAEQFRNEQKFTDGEIFRQILLNRGKPAEGKWWARLTNAKQKDLKQLLKNYRFATAFGNLIDFWGLWDPIELGTLHRFLTLRCDEEILYNLEHVRAVWMEIMDGVRPPIDSQAIDISTVASLELLAPFRSQQDLNSVRLLMQERTIFTTVSDKACRTRILGNIAALRCAIPSLRTLFENLKHIEPCCIVLKQLLNLERGQTIRQGFMACYYHQPKTMVEYAEGDLRPHTTLPIEEARWLGYTQLWAYCLRHFPRMTQITPRKEPGKQKPMISEPHPALWQRLGELATALGFRSRKAACLQQKSPYYELAKQFLNHAIGITDAPDHEIDAIAKAAKRCKPSQESVVIPTLTCSKHLPLERRCGRPFENDYANDKNYLFVPNFLHGGEETGLSITSYFVKYDLFYSFLGGGPLQPTSLTFNSPKEGEDQGDSMSIVSSPVSAQCSLQSCSSARELASLREEFATISGRVDSSQRREEQLQRELSAANNEQKACGAELQAQVNALAAMQKDRDLLKQSLEEVQSQIRDANDGRSKAIVGTETLRKDFNELQKRYREVESEKRDLQVQCQRQRVEREQLASSNVQAEQLHSQLDARANKAITERDKLRSNLEEIQNQETRATQARKELESQLEQLQTQLEAKTNEAITERDKLQSEVERIQNQENIAIQGRTELQFQVERLEAQIKAMEDTVTMEIEQLRSKLVIEANKNKDLALQFESQIHEFEQNASQQLIVRDQQLEVVQRENGNLNEQLQRQNQTHQTTESNFKELLSQLENNRPAVEQELQALRQQPETYLADADSERYWFICVLRHTPVGWAPKTWSFLQDTAVVERELEKKLEGTHKSSVAFGTKERQRVPFNNLSYIAMVLKKEGFLYCMIAEQFDSFVSAPEASEIGFHVNIRPVQEPGRKRKRARVQEEGVPDERSVVERDKQLLLRRKSSATPPTLLGPKGPTAAPAVSSTTNANSGQVVPYGVRADPLGSIRRQDRFEVSEIEEVVEVDADADSIL